MALQLTDELIEDSHALPKRLVAVRSPLHSFRQFFGANFYPPDKCHQGIPIQFLDVRVLIGQFKKRSIAFLRFIYRINDAQTINRLFKANRLSLELREHPFQTAVINLPSTLSVYSFVMTLSIVDKRAFAFWSWSCLA